MFQLKGELIPILYYKGKFLPNVIDKFEYRNYEVTEFIQDGTLMFIVRIIKK